MISESDVINKCSVLLFFIEVLETWVVVEDTLVDDSLEILVVSEGYFIHNCSLLLLVIEVLETWVVAKYNLADGSLWIGYTDSVV